MKLVASLIVRNEADRYLELCVDHLLEFCDEIVVLDDGSTDGSAGILRGKYRVNLEESYLSKFYTHEGQARQALTDFTLMQEPTHVLSIDADEFISDGPALRQILQRYPLTPAWTLCMQEIWRADDYLWTREDGGWCSHEIAGVWLPELIKDKRIANRKLACGRVPQEIDHLVGRRYTQYSETSILHFGWTCEADRPARYQRYVEHDSGQFHASAHLQSIMWPDEKVKFEKMDWPAGLSKEIRTRANRG